jgi:uncharacterized protein YyaL (SSP411 family)
MADAWRERRSEVEQQAASLARAIRHHLGDRPQPSADLPSPTIAGRSLAALRQGFDSTWGGFGGAPKFPTPSNLLLLLEVAPSEEQAAGMLSTTLDRMARGGICDQLGGGFHRYATDREWNVPHFEKMLYDNAWLLEVYAREWARTEDRQAARVAREVVAFLDREMTSPEGAYWSALDAETDGREGAYYVWTRDELLRVLGEEDFGFLAPVFGFDGQPFFEGDSYVPHLPLRLEAQAERRRMRLEELREEIDPLRRKLLRARSARKRPLTDDKILTDWNGMTIAALATAGPLLGDRSLIERAATAASFLLAELRGDRGELLHVWRAGRAHEAAMLSDYVFLVRALLALDRASDEPRWREEAVRLATEQQRLFADRDGGFYLSQAAADLLVRSRDLFDGAVPAANAVAVLNLLELAELDAAGPWRGEAEAALRAFAPVLEHAPHAARTLVVALLRSASDSRTDGGVGAARELESDPSGGDPVTVAVSWHAPSADGSRRFELELEISPGWHVYASYPPGEAPEWVTPLRIEGVDGAIESLELPSPEALPALPGREPVLVYEGGVRVGGNMTPSAAQPRLEVTYQACDERRCRTPVTRAFSASDSSG